MDPFERVFPYLIVDGFLGNDLVERLLKFVQSREADFVPAVVVTRSLEANSVPTKFERKLAPEKRKSKVLMDLGDLRSEIEVRFREVMPLAVSELKLMPFELSHCELELVAHQDGAFFKRHIDTRTGTSTQKLQRILTGVLYFHVLPKSFDGGEIRLLPLIGDSFVDIEPLRDRLILFPSWAPHEVMPVSCPSGAFGDSRFAINCWFRRKNHEIKPDE